MAVKKAAKKVEPETQAEPATVVIELAKAKTYHNYLYNMTFIGGAVYTFVEADARKLLALRDDMNVPYFRVHREPEPEPTPEELVASQGVQSLPQMGNDLSSADLKALNETDAPASNAPQPTNVVAPKAPQEPTGDVDSGEIDTGAGVEI